MVLASVAFAALVYAAALVRAAQVGRKYETELERRRALGK